MAEKTKPCPKCSGTMSYRLGEFTCDQCGHTEAVELEQPASKAASGPGFQSGQHWSGRQSVPPPALGAAPPPPGTLYSPGQVPAGDRRALGAPAASPITGFEYLLVGCIAFFLPIVGVGFAWYWSKNNRPGAESCLPWAWGWWGLNVLFIILAAIFGVR